MTSGLRCRPSMLPSWIGPTWVPWPGRSVRLGPCSTGWRPGWRSGCGGSGPARPAPPRRCVGRRAARRGRPSTAPGGPRLSGRCPTSPRPCRRDVSPESTPLPWPGPPPRPRPRRSTGMPACWLRRSPCPPMWLPARPGTGSAAARPATICNASTCGSVATGRCCSQRARAGWSPASPGSTGCRARSSRTWSSHWPTACTGPTAAVTTPTHAPGPSAASTPCCRW